MRSQDSFSVPTCFAAAVAAVIFLLPPLVYLAAHSFQPTMSNMGVMTLGSLLLAIGAFLAVRRMPLKTLRKSFAAVAKERDRLQHIAYHDVLTGLPNKNLFLENLSAEITRAQKLDRNVAVLFLDLDRFKKINDSLGHGIGDHLLVSVARRLEQCVRPTDTVSRLGGDAFAALAGDLADPEDAGAVALKIIEAIAKPFCIQGRELHVSTSIGITVCPQDGTDVNVLLRNADTAMYHAKDGGRNTYKFFAPPMNAKAIQQLDMENALHAALENNEFVLEYQPKLRLDEGRVAGVEALLRWHSRELGLVMPSDFIPRLEESQAIVDVGYWALRTAIMQAKAWYDAGRPLIVSVNISARQFKQEGLVSTVEMLLREFELDPSWLQLEITESLLLEEGGDSEAIMRELIALGVNISLDDFGTGFSSLSYLTRFPISELKIDRSFIEHMDSSDTTRQIIKTVIDLGRALGMSVTAEGVENEQQCAGLRDMGCNEIQGYWLSRPLKAADVAAWMDGRHPA